MALDDKAGRQFGDLVAQWPVGRTRQKVVVWLCVCKCGQLKLARSLALNFGTIKSCGCSCTKSIVLGRLLGLSERGHGRKHTPEYRSWEKMLSRCTNPHNNRFELYAGRGITVCDRWRHSFELFLADMGKRPRGTSIERIENDGNYEPGNCKWATPKEQISNRRRPNNWKLDTLKALAIKGLIADGASRKEIASRFGISVQLVSDIKFHRRWKSA